ncbi:MAG: diguanylate cyclase [Desulfobacteraceae bacterium]|nr:diguanylate cyclase [Desulfobacteraceae bacterium]MBC2755459.1 diguanylate cyclase [Desulfobacteraceae bacterium]
MKYQKLLYFLQNVGRDPSSLMLEDYLTGLKNRRYFLQYLKKNVDWNALDTYPVSLLMVDIDYFKRINDQYGSGVGDQVLVHVAKILKKISGKRGIPVLYAGDEFMFLFPNIKKHNALIIAAELIDHVNENSFFSSDAGTEIPITLSIGAATAPDDAGSGKELLSQVKNALYHAKQAGRNQYADSGEVTRQAVQYLDRASIVGRKRQFKAVNDALKRISDGISQFVIIDGATGMGKTSFLDIVHRNLEKTKLTTIRVSGVTQESFRPYYLVSCIVTELMNQREDKGIGILEAMDEKELERLANILPQLGEADLTAQEIDERQREAIFRSFTQFFVLLVEDGKLAVLIDDMDYSDPASLHLLRVTMREKSLVLFICGTATQDSKVSPKTIPLDLFRSAYSEKLGIQSIEMTPLDVKDIEQHVKVIFPEIDMPQRLTRELAEISKGSPLFVEEILRKMISDQKIVQSGRRWKVMKLEKGYFPKSIEEIIRTKILALDGDSQRFLDCASAFGESISLSMLTGVSEEKSAMVHDFLNRIIDQGIVRSDFKDNDETVRFLSKSIQGVIYDGIQPDQKKSLHEQIGNYQEKLFQHNLLPSASFLAHHYKRSDNQEKAQIYEKLQTNYNQKVFNDHEVARYAVNEKDDDGSGGADEIGDIPLSDESLKYIPKLLQSMLITIRNTRLYPPESKSVTNSVHQLTQLVEKVLEDTERFSIITEKNSILINGQLIEVGNFQSIAQKIIDFWDRLQLKCLTFVKGFKEEELKIILGRICRIEPKEITPRYWKTFSEKNQLTHIHPRQIKYMKVESPASGLIPDTEDIGIESVSLDRESGRQLDDSGLGIIQRVISTLLGAYSKLKLYPAHGPVAKEAAEQVISELKVFFEKQPVLNIARIETSLLVNGVKLDTFSFDAMANSFIKLLSDARLNSVTFLSKVSLSDMVGFISAASESSERGLNEAFWQEIAAEKQIKGILFDQRTYEIFDEHPGESGMEPGSVIEEALMAEEVETPEETEKEFDINGFPDRLRELFLSGDRSGAGILLQHLCDKYKVEDEPGRKSILDIFDTILKPEDWRPSASYLKFILTQAIPLFEGEVNSRLNSQAGELLQDCSKVFILFGEYTLGAWIFTKLRNLSGTKSSPVFDEVNASGKPLDPKIIEIVIDDLKSEDRSRQQDAFQLLSNLGSWIVPLLIETIKRESNMRTRRLGAELIKNKGNDAVLLFKKSLMNESRPEYRARIMDVIDSVTQDLMMELTDTLSDPADVVRRSAIRMAERLNTPEVIQLLIELARGDDPDLAAPAINSLGKLNAAGAAERLISVLENPEEKEVVVAACRAMGQIADPLFVVPLENILMPKRRLFFQKKIETAVRVAAVYAISQIKDSRVAPLLNALADDPDYRVREVLKNLR